MTLWRISRFADLSGLGGLRASGRWHVRGTPIVYLSDHPATCLVEMLVQVGRQDLLPPTYQWLRVDTGTLPVPDAQVVPVGGAQDLRLTQAIGRDWLASSTSALLRVPSVVAPASWNVLLNPAHPDASRMQLVDIHHWPIDPRLQSPPTEPPATR